MWQEFEKLQPEEGTNPADFEPGIYSHRTNEAGSDNKGLIMSTSTKPARPTARSVPDEELTPESEMHDAIVPPSHRGSPKATPAQQLRRKSSTASHSSITSSSPVSTTFVSTLGPATAATAALGQKAAGMFSNVSSFFQTKKKEIIDAQRDAEEQYQQRIHQHERRQKVMQERARATASTFAISPKPSPKSIFGSGSTTPSTPLNTSSPGVFVYVPPKSPTSPKGEIASTLPIASVIPPGSSNDIASSSSDSGPTSIAETVPIVAPIPTLPMVSPTLTRGSGGITPTVADKMTESLRDPQEGDLDQESQRKIEKELQEALESESDKISHQQLSVADATGNVGLSITPTRSLTPAESYSPFLEISAPSSPFKPDTDPLGVSSSKEDVAQSASSDRPADVCAIEESKTEKDEASTSQP